MYSWQEKRLSDFSKFHCCSNINKVERLSLWFLSLFLFQFLKVLSGILFCFVQLFLWFFFWVKVVEIKEKTKNKHTVDVLNGKKSFFHNKSKKYQTESFSLAFYCEKLQRQAKNTKKSFCLVTRHHLALFFLPTKHHNSPNICSCCTHYNVLRWNTALNCFFSVITKAKQQQNKLNEEETQSKQTSFQLTWIILFLSLFCFSKINLSSYFLLTLVISFLLLVSFSILDSLLFNTFRSICEDISAPRKLFTQQNKTERNSNVIPWAKKKKRLHFYCIFCCVKQYLLLFWHKNILTSEQFCLKWKTKFGVFCWYFRQSVGWVIWCLGGQNKTNNDHSKLLVSLVKQLGDQIGIMIGTENTKKDWSIQTLFLKVK